MTKSLLNPTKRSLSLAGSGLIASLVFGIGAVANVHAAEGQSQSDLTPLTMLRAQVRDLLRQEATLDPGMAKDAATTALCDLYVVLRNDERFDSSEMLRGDAMKVRRRLISIAKRLENQLKRDRVPKPFGLSRTVDAEITAAVSASQSLSETNSADAKPNADGAQNAGHAPGAFPDTGWELVELIQRVVAPDFWESRGGPGTIRYFAMRRVLVVRATTDVHEQIRDLLMALR